MMIKLTRLNDKEMVINAEMIEFVEATPDTLISLESGKKIMVMEPVEEVIELNSADQANDSARVAAKDDR